MPKNNKRRFPLAVRIVCIILIASFLAYDISWANPDALQIQLKSPKDDFRLTFEAKYLAERARDIAEFIESHPHNTLADIALLENASDRMFDGTYFTVINTIAGPEEVRIAVCMPDDIVKDNTVILRYYLKGAESVPYGLVAASYFGFDKELKNIRRQILITDSFHKKLISGVKALPGPTDGEEPSGSAHSGYRSIGILDTILKGSVLAVILTGLSGCAVGGTASLVPAVIIGSLAGMAAGLGIYAVRVHKAKTAVNIDVKGAKKRAKLESEARKRVEKTRREFLKISAGGTFLGAFIASMISIANKGVLSTPQTSTTQIEASRAEAVRSKLLARLAAVNNFEEEIGNMDMPSSLGLGKDEIRVAVKIFSHALKTGTIKLIDDPRPGSVVMGVYHKGDSYEVTVNLQDLDPVLGDHDLTMLHEAVHLVPSLDRAHQELDSLEAKVMAKIPGSRIGRDRLPEAIITPHVMMDKELRDMMREIIRVRWHEETVSYFIELAGYDARAKKAGLMIEPYILRIAKNNAKAMNISIEDYMSMVLGGTSRLPPKYSIIRNEIFRSKYYTRGRLTPEFIDDILGGSLMNTGGRDAVIAPFLIALASAEFSEDFTIDKFNMGGAAYQKRFFGWARKNIFEKPLKVSAHAGGNLHKTLAAGIVGIPPERSESDIAQKPHINKSRKSAMRLAGGVGYIWSHIASISYPVCRFLFKNIVDFIFGFFTGGVFKSNRGPFTEWLWSSRATKKDKLFLKALLKRMLTTDRSNRLSEAEALHILVNRLNRDFSLEITLPESADLNEPGARQEILESIFEKRLPVRPGVYVKPYIILLGYVAMRPEEFVRSIYAATVLARPEEEISLVGSYSISEPADAAVHYRQREILFRGEKPLYRSETGYSHWGEETGVTFSEDEDAVAKVAKAMSIIEAKAIHSGSGAIRQVWDRIRPTMTIVSLIGAKSIYADPDDMIIRPYHAGRRRHVMYIPELFLEDFDIDDDEDMNEMAEYIYHVMHWFHIYESEENGSARQRLNEETALLTKRDGRLGLVEAGYVRARLHYLMEEAAIKMSKEIHDHVTTYAPYKNWLSDIKEKIKSTGFNPGNHIAELNEVMRVYLKYAYSCELLGAADEAMEFYKGSHEAARMIQSYESDNSVIPIKLQERMVIFYLKRGMFKEFLRELRVMLTGDGYPEMHLRPGSKYSDSQKARKAQLADMFLYADSRIACARFKREIEYTINYYASINTDKAYRNMLFWAHREAIATIDNFKRSTPILRPADSEEIERAEESGDRAMQEALLDRFIANSFDILRRVQDGMPLEEERIQELYMSGIRVYKMPLIRDLVKKRKQLLMYFVLLNIHPTGIRVGSAIRNDEARRFMLFEVFASPAEDVYKPALETIIEVLAKDESPSGHFHQAFYPLVTESAKMDGFANALLSMLIQSSKGEIELFTMDDQVKFFSKAKEITLELFEDERLPHLRTAFLEETVAFAAAEPDARPVMDDLLKDLRFEAEILRAVQARPNLRDGDPAGSGLGDISKEVYSVENGLGLFEMYFNSGRGRISFGPGGTREVKEEGPAFNVEEQLFLAKVLMTVGIKDIQARTGIILEDLLERIDRWHPANAESSLGEAEAIMEELSGRVGYRIKFGNKLSGIEFVLSKEAMAGLPTVQGYNWEAGVEEGIRSHLSSFTNKVFQITIGQEYCSVNLYDKKTTVEKVFDRVKPGVVLGLGDSSVDISFLSLKPAGVDYRPYYLGRPEDIDPASGIIIPANGRINSEAAYLILKEAVEKHERGEELLSAIIADVDNTLTAVDMPMEPKMADLLSRAMVRGVSIHLITGGIPKYGHYVERIIDPLESSFISIVRGHGQTEDAISQITEDVEETEPAGLAREYAIPKLEELADSIPDSIMSSIRPGKPEDIPSVEKLSRLIFGKEAGLKWRPYRYNSGKPILENSNEFLWVYAVDEGRGEEVKGYVFGIYNPVTKDVVIWEAAVGKKYQDKGVGTALMIRLARNMLAKGATTCTIEVAQPNILDALVRFGFEYVERGNIGRRSKDNSLGVYRLKIMPKRNMVEPEATTGAGAVDMNIKPAPPEIKDMLDRTRGGITRDSMPTPQEVLAAAGVASADSIFDFADEDPFAVFEDSVTDSGSEKGDGISADLFSLGEDGQEDDFTAASDENAAVKNLPIDDPKETDDEMHGFLSTIHLFAEKQYAEQSVNGEPHKILIAEELFNIEDVSIALRAVLNAAHIEILPSKDIRDFVTRDKDPYSRRNLVYILGRTEFNSLWRESHMINANAKVVILDDDFKEARYLFLEAMIGFAYAFMNRDESRIRIYAELLFEETDPDGVISEKIVSMLMKDDSVGLINVELRFKTIPYDIEKLSDYKIMMEEYLRAA
ncbi:MAG: GNAT family N-acetyltransferase [Candidatus Omnitrophica bacterium]|nr:GNAT family N-acetyltransferase [Candidatus Omnitrophota bacterium]